MENVLRTLIWDEQVSLTLVDATEIVNEAIRLHGLSRPRGAGAGKDVVRHDVYERLPERGNGGSIRFAQGKRPAAESFPYRGITHCGYAVISTARRL